MEVLLENSCPTFLNGLATFSQKLLFPLHFFTYTTQREQLEEETVFISMGRRSGKRDVVTLLKVTAKVGNCFTRCVCFRGGCRLRS